MAGELDDASGYAAEFHAIGTPAAPCALDAEPGHRLGVDRRRDRRSTQGRIATWHCWVRANGLCGISIPGTRRSTGAGRRDVPAAGAARPPLV